MPLATNVKKDVLEDGSSEDWIFKYWWKSQTRGKPTRREERRKGQRNYLKK